ncbi:alpha/beta-hydrolase [Aaosphaeria arxii CBS 175.79]|uniref:Alpha/beta-hydrolase n=1 Tax=Aaosphaeria arxii CBS 175.79 TaxID=1450172 RepID=A0A6A5XPH7_9PLEO|nr:alpha/beta-hydrolase [Aaosphaeria arxii CBS 175.79]KAF2014630.1 alpha/beta-hydrolase [Aaosphaeria arxii CBS 175.79]
MATEIDGIQIPFGDARQPKALPLDHPKARWGGFKTETTILRAGHVRRPGCLPLPCDIKFERDQPVKLRDGVTIYVDVYRPVNESIAHPALLAWSPYGKEPGRGNQVLDDFIFRMGVPLHKLSEFQRWEGPDPAYWVYHGFTVVNADPRGVYKSEGNIYQFGSQEGRDGADCVDWIGSQPWCNGKVGLTGNSWLSISQWFIAAERPKYLAAISPWEGVTDVFRHTSLGGVMSKPAMDFNLQLLQVNVGENSWENTVEMITKSLQYGAYHEDKRAKIENIDVPAYVTASWSNPIHSYGTFHGYVNLKSPKWLRVHDTWEWPDYYNEENRTDLHKYFDYYLKGIENDWPSTPRLRAKLIDTSKPVGNSGTDFTCLDFPSPKMKSFKLFLDAENGSLTETYPVESTLSYVASTGSKSLTYTFSRDTKFCGPIQICLQVSVENGTDTDIFVSLDRLPNGSDRPAEQLKIPYERSYQSGLIRMARMLNLSRELGLLFYKGPNGSARLSRRTLREEISRPGFPAPDLSQSKPVKEGQIETVQVPITPMGMLFRAGDRLRVTFSGLDPAIFPPVDQSTLQTADGDHVSTSVNKDVKVQLHYLLYFA